MASSPNPSSSGSRTPPLSPDSRSRSSSTTSTPYRPGHQHRPSQPSGLRNAHRPPTSPEELARHQVEFGQNGVYPPQDKASTAVDSDATQQQGSLNEPSDPASERQALLDHYGMATCGDENCDHGMFSPRPGLQKDYGSFAGSYAPSYTESLVNHRASLGGTFPSAEAERRGLGARGYADDLAESILGDSITDGLLGRPERTGTTHWLAERAGLKRERLMYVFYYFPFANWIRQYRWKYVSGDLIAALTMASFYIPMALSYAANLGHMPPIQGLYSFAFNPFFYALLGTCPQMIVGPEAAGSLLTGSVVTEAIKAGHFADGDGMKAAQVGGMVTGLAGAIILIAGICRLGFLDSVLSRPFLRGFISSIGLVIMINQLIPEMGLESAASHSEKASHGSPLDTLIFLGKNGDKAHKLTCAVSFGTVAIILVLRELKRQLSPIKKVRWIVFIPDRFIVVVLSAVLAWQLDWEGKGVDIMGDIKVPEGQKPFQPHFPFAQDNFKHVSDAFETAFIVALLGFFESCVAAKSLGTGTGKTETKEVKDENGETIEVEESDGIRGMTVSSNRELVALGVANIIGGVFMALPAFGGYGRSKINKSTGGKTPMSSIFLSLITVICVLFLLPYFYYIPKGVLSGMITVVSISLLEEAPHDIYFFWHIGGYIELFLMVLIFLTTFFWSLRGGIIVGIIFSLIRLLKHSTRPRIQIMGRVPGTHEFENAEILQQEGHVEMVPHCLIVKIPEPLTFANTGSLKDRLKRLEDHGTNYAHPALPSVRSREHNKNIIFDINGVTGMDYAAAQVLLEIVTDYIDRGVMVFFCRIPSKRSKVWKLFKVAGIVDICGGEKNFLRSVDEALHATEKRSTFNEYAREADEARRASAVEEGTQTGEEETARRRRVDGVDVERRDYGT